MSKNSNSFSLLDSDKIYNEKYDKKILKNEIKTIYAKTRYYFKKKVLEIINFCFSIERIYFFIFMNLKYKKYSSKIFKYFDKKIE